MFQLAALIATTSLIIKRRRRIEREKFYRLPSDVLQVAKVTQIKNLGGKTLDEIDYKDLEFSISVDGWMVRSNHNQDISPNVLDGLLYKAVLY